MTRIATIAGLALLFFISIWLLCTRAWMAEEFGYVNAEMIVFHFVSPTGGFAKDIALRYAVYVGYAVLITAPFAAVSAWVYGGKGNRFKEFVRAKRILFLAAACLLVVAMIVYERQYGFIAYFVENPEYSTYIDENYAKVAPGEVDFTGARKNLIVLTLESIEDTYNDAGVFGEKLMPGLEELRRNGVYFIGHQQVLGTQWTIGALTSYTLGIPLLIPFYLGNKYGTMYNNFLANAPSILGVLSRHGYKIDLFLGADATFSGMDKLFKQHAEGVDVFDLAYFARTRGDVETIDQGWGWGIHDRYLYARVKERLLERCGNGQPYVVFFQTINTHQPGYPESDCPRKWGDLRDSVAEADALVVDFVEWFKRQEFAADTTLVILGDHILYRTDLGAITLPEIDKRMVYNVFINAAAVPEKDPARRHFASWDFAPTILESMGARLPDRRFGLGVSLFGTGKTLFEKYGPGKYLKNMGLKSKLYNSFF